MIPIALNLTGKKVVVIGGGKVGYRKVKQFMKETTDITVVSLDILDDFSNLDIKLICDNYKKEYIVDAFLVYACTSDKELNKQIIKDANELSILAGSATYDENANFYSMASREVNHSMIALSTNQKFPYTTTIMDELEKTYLPYHHKIELLGQMRPYLLQHVSSIKDYYNLALSVDESILEFICEAIKAQKGSIFIYHPTDAKQNWVFETQPQLVIDFEQYSKIKDLLNIDLVFDVYPLVLYKGFILKKIQNMVQESFRFHQPFIQDSKDVRKIIGYLKDDSRTNVIVTHNRTSSELISIIHQEFDFLVIDINQEIILEKDKSYQVILLFTEHGGHEASIRENLEKMGEKGYDIHIVGPLVDHKEILKFYLERG